MLSASLPRVLQPQLFQRFRFNYTSRAAMSVKYFLR